MHIIGFRLINKTKCINNTTSNFNEDTEVWDLKTWVPVAFTRRREIWNEIFVRPAPIPRRGETKFSFKVPLLSPSLTLTLPPSSQPPHTCLFSYLPTALLRIQIPTAWPPSVLPTPPHCHPDLTPARSLSTRAIPRSEPDRTSLSMRSHRTQEPLLDTCQMYL